MSANVKLQDLSISSFDHQISVEVIKGGCYRYVNSCGNGCGNSWFGFPSLPRFGGWFFPFFNPFARGR